MPLSGHFVMWDRQ